MLDSVARGAHRRRANIGAPNGYESLQNAENFERLLDHIPLTVVETSEDWT